MSNHTAPIRFRRASTLTLGGNNILRLVAMLIEPLSLVLSVWAVAYYIQGELTPNYLILSLLIFSVTLPGTVRLQMNNWQMARSVIFGWLIIAPLLIAFGYASGFIFLFERNAILIWLWFAPLTQFVVHVGLRGIAPSLANIQGEPKRAVIAGANERGINLARQIELNPYSATKFVGFFDDRVRERVGLLTDFILLGNMHDLPRYVSQNNIEAIYVSLPMATQPRIVELLDALSDTTVSIYFVPDMFVTDLMQGRIDSVGEIPVVAVCESPFTGVNGIVKRGSDIILSIIILLLISPIMVIIAMSIALTSPGAIIFQQRRYGLNGEEIMVSKFRSMTVCEDGDTVQQAQKNDRRVTTVGAFLRKTSLDELPQFFNVLQGRMSIVGPRPHAIVHNELYRTMIKGYMVRHKIKPGITGWAQVNGWRGETNTLDKMKKRIDYDLAYLQNWSLRLDLYIIMKTITVVIKDKNAY